MLKHNPKLRFLEQFNVKRILSKAGPIKPMLDMASLNWQPPPADRVAFHKTSEPYKVTELVHSNGSTIRINSLPPGTQIVLDSHPPCTVERAAEQGTREHPPNKMIRLTATDPNQCPRPQPSSSKPTPIFDSEGSWKRKG
jgi:hypothetical protein